LEGFLGTSDEEFEWALQMNFFTALRAPRAVLPAVLERGGGASSLSRCQRLLSGRRRHHRLGSAVAPLPGWTWRPVSAWLAKFPDS
jgi:hypothetical protein